MNDANWDMFQDYCQRIWILGVQTEQNRGNDFIVLHKAAETATLISEFHRKIAGLMK